MLLLLFFFFKQKTAYEMRISDWSSDVFSSDLNPPHILGLLATSIALTTSKIPFLEPVGAVEMNSVNGQWIANANFQQLLTADAKITVAGTHEIGRASCRVRGGT